MHEQILDEIAAEKVVSSRGRHIPRGVKQKMSNYPIRARDTVPTQPTVVRVVVVNHDDLIGIAEALCAKNTLEM
jgi:hypothetical protein